MKNAIVVDQIRQLDQQIVIHPEDDQLWLERGNLYWKLQEWKPALEDYTEAIRLNPQSPAVAMKEMALQIISFYHKDMYNP